jgi:perosamine synthetase
MDTSASKHIRVFKPCIGQEEIDAVTEVLRSGWIGLGPKTDEFEKRFAQFCNVEYAVGVNSGTAALDLAMKLLGVNHGDEVIVPTITFVSTAHVVSYNLGTPIFADVDPLTMNIDPEDAKHKISRRTKALIAVHYAGRPADLEALKLVAQDIPIVEDCAHATGAKYRGKPVGGLGSIGSFSFHAVKNLATGDGGALTLNNTEWYERAKKLRWLGIDKSTWDRSGLDRSYWWQYRVDEIGLKCHMNDIMASLGLVQLRNLETMNRRRKEIAEIYFNGLKDISQVELPPKDDAVHQSSWHIFHIKCKARDDLSMFLQNNGIATGVHYAPIHTYKCYGNTTFLKNAEALQYRILTLPLYPELTNDEVNYVIEKIHDFYQRL